jgi:hypothetical protein
MSTEAARVDLPAMSNRKNSGKASRARPGQRRRVVKAGYPLEPLDLFERILELCLKTMGYISKNNCQSACM